MRIIKSTFLTGIFILATGLLLGAVFIGGYKISTKPFERNKLAQTETPPSPFVSPELSEVEYPDEFHEPTIAFNTPVARVLDGGKLFNLVNQYRLENGSAQLSWYHPLCTYSQKRSQEIKDDWSHTGYLEDAKTDFYKIVCPECFRTGENLAKDYKSEEMILKAWIKSPSHKKNLDEDWDWGCAYFYSNNYVSFIFGKKKQ